MPCTGSVVGRVRQLLSDFGSAMEYPGDPSARARLAREQRRGTAVRDLSEVQDRVRRLKACFPEIEGVEVGPLLAGAREFLGDRAGPSPRDPIGPRFSRGGRTE
jgi:hypothetical protein